MSEQHQQLPRFATLWSLLWRASLVLFIVGVGVTGAFFDSWVVVLVAAGAYLISMPVVRQRDSTSDDGGTEKEDRGILL